MTYLFLTYGALSLLLPSVLSLTSCTHTRHTIIKKTLEFSASKSHPTIYPKPPPLTIWIHGTRFFPNSLLSPPYASLPCLLPARCLEKKNGLRKIASTLSQQDPILFPFDTFYIFCWSGKLSAQLREAAAYDLYNALQPCIDQYCATYTCTPCIHIITHSHGGNVALNLGKIPSCKESNLVIDKLILLACPVQDSTTAYSANPIFKEIYSLYSSLDFIQVIAPQIYKNFTQSEKGSISFFPFSTRRFPSQCPIHQVKLKINKHGLLHNEFVEPYFLRFLPDIIRTIKMWDNESSKTVNSTMVKLLHLKVARKHLSFRARRKRCTL